MEPPPPDVVASRTVYTNPWLSVREDVLRRADGSTGIYGVVAKHDFALIIAEEVVGRDRGFHLVEQYRHPVESRSWEFPMGTWPPGAPSTGALALAQAELREETGLTARTWRHLGRLHLAPGYSTQHFDAFHACDLVAGPHAREAGEADMVHAFVPERRFEAMIRDGHIVDGPTLAAYLLLRLQPGRDCTLD
jgi:8-oxo-dGTP pyrophosphatase MutT (NUDIX family)